jgi:hypothetical protein
MSDTYKTSRADSGVLKNDTAHVPEDPANRDFAGYQAHVLEGGDTDDALVLDIEDAIAAAVRAVELEADRRRHARIPAGATSAALLIFRHLEAVPAIAEGGSADPADYPLLAALMPSVGETVGAVATATQATFNLVKGEWKDIETVRAAAVFSLASATNQAQIDAILAAISWPTFS